MNQSVKLFDIFQLVNTNFRNIDPITRNLQTFDLATTSREGHFSLADR